jgi:hypothetical protein
VGGHASPCRSAAASWSRGSATAQTASSISCQSLGQDLVTVAEGRRRRQPRWIALAFSPLQTLTAGICLVVGDAIQAETVDPGERTLCRGGVGNVNREGGNVGTLKDRAKGAAHRRDGQRRVDRARRGKINHTRAGATDWVASASLHRR